MKGWLVVNEFLQSEKFNEIHSWLLQAANRQDMDLVLKTNASLMIELPACTGDAICLEKPDFILFWDKDIRLAEHLEKLGFPVFNRAVAIEICDDKSLTHMVLMHAGIRMPGTIIAPKTFDNIGYTNLEFVRRAAERLGFPMVVKECFGSFGQQVYLAHNYMELTGIISKAGAKPVLFQEFISASAGRDIRLQVVGGRVITSMYRYSVDGDFRANLTIGGRMEPYQPSAEQCRLALECCKRIGLDFAGVDILFGENDEPIVCEVNSNAHFKNIYDCTGVNAADAIISHIKSKLKEKA